MLPFDEILFVALIGIPKSPSAHMSTFSVKIKASPVCFSEPNQAVCGVLGLAYVLILWNSHVMRQE